MLTGNRGYNKPQIPESKPLYSFGAKRAEAVDKRTFDIPIQHFLEGLDGFELGWILFRMKSQIQEKPVPSLAFGCDLIADAKLYNCTLALNGEPGVSTLYAAPLSRFSALGFTKDYGWGKQRFLPLRFWDTLDTQGIVHRAKLPRQPELVQGYLFREM